MEQPSHSPLIAVLLNLSNKLAKEVKFPSFLKSQVTTVWEGKNLNALNLLNILFRI